MAEKMAQFSLKVKAKDNGLRLDQYIIKNLAFAISRTKIQRLINSAKITVNQNPVKAHYKVRENDSLIIDIPAPDKHRVLPEKIALGIVFEDDDILVINKPKDMVTHPAPGVHSGTLVNALLNYGCALSTINGPLRPGIVHRLDKDTTGLMVIAKNDFTHLRLAQQFKRRTVKRKYIAVVEGSLSHNEGVIDYPIGRHPRNRQKMTVSFLKKARPAITKYKVLKRTKGATLLELRLHTGRTHQLKVHLKFCGHPILGDKRYGNKDSARRLALHAQALGFEHPRTGKFVEFKSDIPEYFRELLKSDK